MMNQQCEREKINLNIKKTLLDDITNYCKEQGYIRNKFIERLIMQQWAKENGNATNKY